MKSPLRYSKYSKWVSVRSSLKHAFYILKRAECCRIPHWTVCVCVYTCPRALKKGMMSRSILKHPSIINIRTDGRATGHTFHKLNLFLFIDRSDLPIYARIRLYEIVALRLGNLSAIKSVARSWLEDWHLYQFDPDQSSFTWKERRVSNLSIVATEGTPRNSS